MIYHPDFFPPPPHLIYLSNTLRLSLNPPPTASNPPSLSKIRSAFQTSFHHHVVDCDGGRRKKRCKRTYWLVQIFTAQSFDVRLGMRKSSSGRHNQKKKMTNRLGEIDRINRW
ncbi:unnamed protein product [Lactuca virosa]|uniref:Uncharacterized protein n=1 Tax=Lactuca virosa TaxID=75947 RepID=A0AAU9N4A4_9ASTR|nr:unnamed protein product [Lactuca virosa]